MARYIDADKFKSILEKAMEKMHLIGGVKGVDVGAVIAALDRQPTADVAPRAEVAREIFWEIDMLLMSITIDEEAEESFVGLDFDKYLAIRRKYTKVETEMPKGD